MITVNVVKKNSSINSIAVTGHGQPKGYEGHDLVCAGVSSIMFGSLNALAEKGLDDIKIEDNLIVISNIPTDETIQTIIETTLVQLKTIEDQYNKNIQIIEEGK